MFTKERTKSEEITSQSRLHKIPKAEAEARMKILIAAFGLERYLNYPVNSYSGGVKRRLDIALNMMSNPKILFLDEPTVGMDLQSRQAMHIMMKKIRRDFGTTIFLTTHYLEEADSLSDRICIIRGGKEAAQGSPKDLRRYLKQNFLKVSFEDQASANDARSCLPELFATDTVRRYFIWGRAYLFCENCFWFCRHAADCTDCIPDSFFHVRSDLCNQPAPAQRGHLRNCHECSRAASLFSQHRLISRRYLDRSAENNSQSQSPHPRNQHFAHLAVTGRSPLA